MLFYQSDSQLRLVSRHRDRLAQAFRFVLAEPLLVESLLDKAKFQDLAERMKLPVPAARRICPTGNDPEEIGLNFPIIVKPVQHAERDMVAWKLIASSHKALLVETPETLRVLWPHFVAANLDLLFQEAILGPENRIESYHVYLDQTGAIVAEFTGRKIRTLPVTCGLSTAVETTDAADVREIGRDIVQKLDLRGVAKLDFKRCLKGNLYLLEINPRFNLWHHLGAVAGVNLPGLVYADLTGLPRPVGRVARAGVRWVAPWADMRAAQESGIPITTWLWWLLHCEAKAGIAWDDPMPIVKKVLARIPRSRGALAQNEPYATS
ncbi:ATP-grasp domain-containing protein [Microvirga sp. VF16]|uniref:carboxylate--amine ligase n=1 Tax=Microvirga sp. VF16 TaxID=2807101 RepID=UPI00193DDE71|nr:ATP-grasp domain-containing protein [Microvirga sp. VF16]QRM27237.1 ATP-grasp domain-containing protein [Microvirga sp. VF16]